MSLVGRLIRRVHPGVREVHAHVARYASAWAQANEEAMAGAGPLWVVLGDSTAQGVGAPSHDQGYVGQLRTALDDGAPVPWRVLNLSKSGARAVDVLDRQLPALGALADPPVLVTCAIGANDIVRRTPRAVLAAQLRQIMARLPEGTLIATIPQGLSRERTQAANTVIRDGAPPAGLLVADVWARTGSPWRGKYASDGFHPGPLGYADWAAAFAEALPKR